MSVRCRFCGEPYDVDTLHDEVAERRRNGERAPFAKVVNEFRRTGCAALRLMGMRDCRRVHPTASPVATAIFAYAGSDMDGASADCADAEMLGLL